MVSPRYCSFSSLTRRPYSYLSSWSRIYHLSLMVYGLLLLNIVLAQNYRATLKIYNGEAITLSQQNLAIFTNNNNQQINPNIQYQVMHVENGYFRRNQSSTSELSQFRQKDIEQGLIQFVHQADQEKPLIQLLYYDTTSSSTSTKSTLTMDVQFTMFRKNAFGAPTPLIQHEYKNGQIILQIRMYKKNLETQQRAYYNLGLSYSSSNMDGYVCTNQNILKNNFKLYQDADYYQIYQSSIPLNDFIKQSSTESAMTNGALQSFYNTIYMTYMFVTNQDVSQCYTVSFKRNFILHVGLSVSCVGSTSLTIINVCTNEKEKLQVMCEFEWPNDMDSCEVRSNSIQFCSTEACLSCTSQAMIVYLVINSVGVSFQYKAQSLNNCPLEILQNFNPSNYTDSEAYHLPKISYSPQYTVSDIMNVTISSSSSGSSSSDMITLYGNLYQQNTLLHTVCMVIDASLSNQAVNNIYLNMAKNGSCPKVISSSAIGNTCKLSSDMKYVVEQVLVIRRK